MRAVYKSPLGLYEAVYERDTLLSLSFALSGEETRPEDELGRALFRQLDEYFAGRRRVFDLPMTPRGTPFQQRVWRGLMDIPYGSVWTYGQLAAHIGCPGGARAVGGANSKNPIPVIVPCHRVVAAGGIGGYTGADISVKRALLRLEGVDNKQFVTI